MIVAQEQELTTNNLQEKNICVHVFSMSRLCGEKEETVVHTA